LAIGAVAGAGFAALLVVLFAETSALGVVGAAIAGAVGGIVIVAGFVEVIILIGEWTGLSDPDSRFPRIRGFFERLEVFK
jgi:hypothetical protein